MTTLKDDCKCGHDRIHHFDKTHNCLAMRCECKRFRAEGTPDTIPPTDRSPDTPRMRDGKPHNDTACTCAACQAWLRKRWAWSWP
jgi:hypothetical protein